MGLRLPSVIRMKLLVLLAFVALAQAEAQPDAVAAPDADALLYHPYYNLGYYGYPRYIFGRKRRDAEAEAALMLMPMLMLVSCTAFTTPTTTSATMDIPGMCLDARGVMLKLPQRLMLMPDIMDTILIM